MLMAALFSTRPGKMDGTRTCWETISFGPGLDCRRGLLILRNELCHLQAPVKTCVIFNPAARGEKANRFRQHLGTLSEQCALKPTYAAGAGRALAAEAVREGFELI